MNRNITAPLGHVVCPACFIGFRGRYRCAMCDGTGSIFRDFEGRAYPNTVDGYKAALAARDAFNGGEP